MADLDSTSQWENLLKNLGVWQGSFTRLSPDGTVTDDRPSRVTLSGLNDNQTIRQTIEFFASETSDSDAALESKALESKALESKVLEYSSLNRSTLVFPDGAFCQGSLQYGPFSEFGAEFGFINGDRRLRLVQLFDKASQLASFTLIREHRQGTAKDEKPPLTLEQLEGVWCGEAITLYPNWQTPSQFPTKLLIERQGDRLLQTLTMPQFELSSTAQIAADRLEFSEGKVPMQVLLLPDGASANTPRSIPKGQPFLLEAGWLINPTLRQRLIRSYDAQGGWSSLTLVTERRSA